MVRVTKVSVVEKPDVSDVRDFVIRSREELVKVLCRLNQVGKPDHCGQIWVSSLDEFSSQSDLVVILLISCLYNITMIIKVLI